MPGFDGTGPVGRGPVTGGGRGRCSAYGAAGFQSGWIGQGRGAGRGFRGMFRATGIPGWFRGWSGNPSSVAENQGDYRDREVESLKNEAAALKDHMNAVESRLKALESEGKA